MLEWVGKKLMMKLLLHLITDHKTNALPQLNIETLFHFILLSLFILSQNFIEEKSFPKWDYLRYTPPSMCQVIVQNNQIFFDIPRQVSTTSLKDCNLEIEFNVTHRATAHAQYADLIPIGLVKIGPVASFIKNRFITFKGKEKTDLNDAHIKCSIYIIKTSRKDNDHLSIGFHRNITSREQERTNNKTTKRKCLVKIFVEVVFSWFW